MKNGGKRVVQVQILSHLLDIAWPQYWVSVLRQWLLLLGSLSQPLLSFVAFIKDLHTWKVKIVKKYRPKKRHNYHGYDQQIHCHTCSPSLGGSEPTDIRCSTIQFNRSLVACALASSSLYRFSIGSTSYTKPTENQGKGRKVERVSTFGFLEEIITILRSSSLEL